MASQKNILLLVADDLGRCLGCYGDKVAKTPNIDRLAASGTLFTRAFTSTASCSGSRSVIYTGLHTHESGQYGLNNGRHHFSTYDHVETAPAVFQSQGLDYLTGILGKVHVGPQSVYPWELREESTSRDVAWVADKAGEFFEKAKGQARSFFLTVGYIDPHRDRTRDGFGNDEEFDARRVNKMAYKPEDVPVLEYIQDLPEVRHELANYYESISRLDQGVGLMLEALEASGMAEDTLVVFLSDNGAPFLNSKTTLYDAGVRLPLIVRRPGVQAGIANPNMVSFIDILPTLLDWAGASHLRADRLGRSFLDILEQEHVLQEWTQVFGSHTFHEITNYYPTRFMRTERYKYHRNIEHKLDFPFAADLYGSLAWEGIRNCGTGMIGPRSLEQYMHRPREELYDLENDPHEVDNLALGQSDAETMAVLEKMRKALEMWQLQTRDPWLYRDGQSVELNRHHIEAGMVMPDRWEFDVKNCGTNGCKAFKLESLQS
ncbi:alkaline phosphatase-like protein [Trematosphaeria pertusa]|uniref:Alkaline phosphatase-like protein n=1 Tax=Trematosphaeria pertusa TaxID=390896 RepID=A0A6A6IU11_9PLEO|nr:alkaline phosphatase-like protein [Trematosphaeria pertusa]KAF2253859.1 alkaline phosphatase-like protein [Trematosphaeria pertusa]